MAWKKCEMNNLEAKDLFHLYYAYTGLHTQLGLVATLLRLFCLLLLKFLLLYVQIIYRGFDPLYIYRTYCKDKRGFSKTFNNRWSLDTLTMKGNIFHELLDKVREFVLFPEQGHTVADQLRQLRELGLVRRHHAIDTALHRAVRRHAQRLHGQLQIRRLLQLLQPQLLRDLFLGRHVLEVLLLGTFSLESLKGRDR